MLIGHFKIFMAMERTVELQAMSAIGRGRQWQNTMTAVSHLEDFNLNAKQGRSGQRSIP
jgi:hypothetical protein